MSDVLVYGQQLFEAGIVAVRCNSDICREQGIDVFRALQSFRGQFECPRNDKRDWKTDRDQRNHQPHNPIWNLEKWETCVAICTSSQPTMAYATATL